MKLQCTEPELTHGAACLRMRTRPLFFFAAALLSAFLPVPAFSAADVTPWGNLQGMRIEGSLMRFDTALAVVDHEWSGIVRTGKGKQLPAFFRDGSQRVVTTQIGNVAFRQTVTDVSPVTSRLDLSAEATSDTVMEGAYLVVQVAEVERDGESVRLYGPDGEMLDPGAELDERLVARVTVVAPGFGLELALSRPAALLVRRQETSVQIFVRVLDRNARRSRVATTSLTLTVAGLPDKSDLTFAIEATREGRTFRGLGGNFRLQDANADLPVINYLLETLRIVAARTELPLAYWQPDEDVHPLAALERRGLDPRVAASMQLARNLAANGRPILLSIWSAPPWAILGAPRRGPKIDGVYGNTWNKEKTPQLYESIAAYLLYLKQHFGTEVDAISLNEPDIGVNVHQPAAEHAAMIGDLGTYLAARGLNTRVLLGDTSDATAWRYMEPALEDARALAFAAAVSFHSWRGLDSRNLRRWHEASVAAGLPLVVAEAGIDPDAWRYPAVFLEPAYALEEIDAYLRLVSIAQPDLIFQWQLTADYPLVRGMGLLGSQSGLLEPTQRFWNLKQLSDTSSDLRSLPLHGNARDVTGAALGDAKQGRYSIHFVNQGATRRLRLEGLPSAVGALRVYVTDENRNMKSEARIPVENGRADLVLEQGTFTTLLSAE